MWKLAILLTLVVCPVAATTTKLEIGAKSVGIAVSLDELFWRRGFLLAAGPHSFQVARLARGRMSVPAASCCGASRRARRCSATRRCRSARWSRLQSQYELNYPTSRGHDSDGTPATPGFLRGDACFFVLCLCRAEVRN